MALVDADYHFIYIDVGNYGSNEDSCIFKNNTLGETFTTSMLNIPPPKRLHGYPEGDALPNCIVTDEAFPLRMHLMRPYPHGKRQDRLPYDKSIFNYRLSRAKRIVENTFGILAQRCRVFDRRIHMDDHNVIKIVNATRVLYNYLCTARMDVANVMARLNPDGQPYLQPQAMLLELQNQGYHSTDAAQRVQRIYKDYINSEILGSSLAGK